MAELVFDVNELDALQAKLRKMASVDVSKTMKKVWGTIMKGIQKHLEGTVKTKYPHGTRKNSGMLRGKKYGPLYKDISTKIWRKGGGACVYIFRNNEGRQCVLRWLDAGTADRQAGTRRMQKPANRSHISAANFFKPSVNAVADNEISKGIVEAEHDIMKIIINAAV